MTRKELIANIKSKRSFLCVGLDTDPAKIPDHLKNLEDPVFEFNKAIIDATSDLAVAYKPNIAFYEAQGIKGWISLKKTIEYIPKDCFVIADAKRGDIGNTSNRYAEAFFTEYNCDAITVAPYMGHDSVEPFLKYPGHWAIVLALTSNEGAMDFQFGLSSGHFLYEKVVEKCMEWGSPENLMFVVGATRGELLGKIRMQAPQHFFLIPGLGAQGGSLQDIIQYALTDDIGVLVNASRSIIYADNSENFASVARSEAEKIRNEMDFALREKGI